MNFKKPLSLLLIVGLATTQMSIASDMTSENDARKAELEAEVANEKRTRNKHAAFSLFSGLITSISCVKLYQLTQEYFQALEPAQKQFSVLCEILESAIKKAAKHTIRPDAESVAKILVDSDSYAMRNFVINDLHIGTEELDLLLKPFKALTMIKLRGTPVYVAAVAGTIATVYCGVKAYQASKKEKEKAYQAWNKAKKYQEKLATLN